MAAKPEIARRAFGRIWRTDAEREDSGSNGGSQAIKRVRVSVGFADMSAGGLSGTLYSLQPGQQLLCVGLHASQAFNDSGGPSSAQIKDSTQAIAATDSTDLTSVQTPVGGLFSVFGSDIDADWGVAKAIKEPSAGAVDFILDCSGSWNADGTTGIAVADFYVANAPS